MESIQGRAPIRLFWKEFVSTIAIFILSSIFVLFSIGASFMASSNVLVVVASAISLFFLAPKLFSLYIVIVKRFHDRDKSGYWSLLLIFPVLIVVLLVGQINSEIMTQFLYLRYIFLFSFLPSLWIFYECAFLKGTPGPNRFGKVIQE